LRRKRWKKEEGGECEDRGGGGGGRVTYMFSPIIHAVVMVIVYTLSNDGECGQIMIQHSIDHR